MSRCPKRMLYWQWVLVAMELYFHVFPLKYKYFENFFIKEHCLKSNLLQLSHNMFCKNVARLAVAREPNYVWQPYNATAKRATFSQNILWENCSKLNFKQCFLKKNLSIIYILAGIHGNMFPWQPTPIVNKASFY